MPLTYDERQRVYAAAQNSLSIPLKRPARVEAMAIREVVLLREEYAAGVARHARQCQAYRVTIRLLEAEALAPRSLAWHLKTWWSRR